MMRTSVVLAVAFLGVQSLSAGVWRGLDEGAYYSGPKLSEADLAGKVVLVDEWGINCPPCRALLPSMQAFWNANKTKPFMLLGSHRQGRNIARVKELTDANKLTYAIYDFAGLASEPENGGGLPFMYVVNERGKVVYSGRDHEACFAAAKAAIQAIGAMPVLCGGVTLKAFKSMEKQLVLGKAIKTQVKALQAAVKKGEAKNATALQQAQGEEASQLLAAIEEAKLEIKQEIDAKSESDPAKAVKLAKAFIVTFPVEGAAYKPQLADWAAKAKAQ